MHGLTRSSFVIAEIPAENRGVKGVLHLPRIYKEAICSEGRPPTDEGRKVSGVS